MSNEKAVSNTVRATHGSADRRRRVPTYERYDEATFDPSLHASFVLEGAREPPKEISEQELKRLQDMRLTPLNEYRERRIENTMDARDDEVERTAFFPTYVDPTLDDSGKALEEPHETEEALKEIRDKLTSAEFRERMTRNYQREAPGGSKQGAEERDDFTKPINTISCPHKKTREELKRIWSNGDKYEKLLSDERGYDPTHFVPAERRIVLCNDAQIMRTMATLAPLMFYPDRSRITAVFLKKKLTFLGLRKVDEYAHQCRLLDCRNLIFWVYANEEFNTLVSTKTIFFLLVALERHTKVYRGHFFEIVVNKPS